jgi:FAD/FMN-containing dehydrogenase
MNNTETLRQRLAGTIILPGNPGYDEARSIWNGMIDRKPAVIVRCRAEADVTHAVKYARENQLAVAIRGGGHNIAGYAVCNGGLMIDLSAMKEVRVNAPARRVYVQPRATLFDVDRATQATASPRRPKTRQASPGRGMSIDAPSRSQPAEPTRTFSPPRKPTG